VTEWDGEFPIAEWLSDNYFFTLEALVDYLWDYELDEESKETHLDVLRGMRLTSCEPSTPRCFEISDLFSDCLGEDQEPPENPELEKAVNDWIKSLGTISWQMTGKRLGMDRIEAVVAAELARYEAGQSDSE